MKESVSSAYSFLSSQVEEEALGMQSLAFYPYCLTLDSVQKLSERTVSLLATQGVTDMHHGAALRADLFRLNSENHSARVDSRIMLKEVDQQEENKTVLRESVSAVDFLAKQGLSNLFEAIVTTRRFF